MKVKMTTVNHYVRLHNSGSIDLEVPAGGYVLDLKGNRIDMPTFKDFSGTFKSRNITGTLSGGGPELTLKSSQRVSLSFK
jgi:hypothetical protein